MDNLKNDFIRSANQFCQVIRSLEKDLHRLRNKDEVPKKYIDEKDLQIDQLVNFYNNADDIINHYELQIKLLKMQNKILEDFIAVKVSKDEEFSDYFLKMFFR